MFKFSDRNQLSLKKMLYISNETKASTIRKDPSLKVNINVLHK